MKRKGAQRAIDNMKIWKKDQRSHEHVHGDSVQPSTQHPAQSAAVKAVENSCAPAGSAGQSRSPQQEKILPNLPSVQVPRSAGHGLVRMPSYEIEDGGSRINETPIRGGTPLTNHSPDTGADQQAASPHRLRRVSGSRDVASGYHLGEASAISSPDVDKARMDWSAGSHNALVPATNEPGRSEWYNGYEEREDGGVGDAGVENELEGVRPRIVRKGTTEAANSGVINDASLVQMLHKQFCVSFPPLQNVELESMQKQAAKSAIELAIKDLGTRISNLADDNGMLMQEISRLKDSRAAEIAAELDSRRDAMKLQQDAFVDASQREVATMQEDYKRRMTEFELQKQNEIRQKEGELEELRQRIVRSDDRIAENEKSHILAVEKKEKEITDLTQRHKQVLVQRDDEISRKNHKLSKKENEIEELRKKHQAELRSEQRGHKDEIEGWATALESAKKGSKEALSAAKIKSSRQLDDLKSIHADTIRDINKNHAKALKKEELANAQALTNLRNQLASANATAAREKQEMTATHQEDTKASLEELRRKFAEERSQLLRDHDEEVKGLRQDVDTIENDAEKAEAKHKTALEDLQQTLEAKQAQLEQQLETEKTKARREMDELKVEHAKIVAGLKEDLGSEKSQLLENQKRREEKLNLLHQQRTKRLHNEVKELNEALSNRDDELYYGELFTVSGLPSKPDEKIRKDFSDISQWVDNLGRVDWKSEQRIWTQEVFQRIVGKHNPRILKKAILQDIIWSQLFHFVFCSPFRVLGEEGRALEGEWNAECGKDPSSTSVVYSWPIPAVKAERWRYFTVKECRDALTKPAPSQWDPRGRLKKGFKSTLDNLIATLKAELGDIVSLNDKNLQLIEQLCEKVAKSLWFDCEMHRCRIVVYLTGSELASTEAKVAQLQEGTLKLTIQPKVGRYGNVKGVDLESFTVIGGCEGESLTVS